MSRGLTLDFIALAVNQAQPEERGYFNVLKKDESSPRCPDEEKQ